jgi:DnaJ-like protein C11, C-terminal
MTSFLRLLAIVAFVSTSTLGFAQDAKTPPELTKLREDYLRRQEAALQPVKAWYRQQLQQMEQAAMQRRDLEAALVIKQEREALGLPTVGTPTFAVIKATYGAGEQTVDVTKQIQALVSSNALRMKAPWGLGVDPAFGKVKELKIRYSHGGTEKTATFDQKDSVSLP